jgi:hypothetical protein
MIEEGWRMIMMEIHGIIHDRLDSIKNFRKNAYLPTKAARVWVWGGYKMSNPATMTICRSLIRSIYKMFFY